MDHCRDAHHRSLLTNRTGFLYRIDEQIIGYGYVGKNSGSLTLYDPRHYPYVLSHAEAESARQGRDIFWLCVPTVNETAMKELLDRGYKMDGLLQPFHERARFRSLRPLPQYLTDAVVVSMKTTA